MDLAGAEQARFARQLVLPGFSEAGQSLLRSARVHLVGAGPLGGPALLYLAQAGVGTLFVDEGEDIVAGDAAAWLYPPHRTGEPRLLSALAAARSASSLVVVRPHGSGVHPTATLVCASARELALSASERARRAGLVHVVALCGGADAEVVAVPSGAPCFRCASRPSSGAPAGPANAAAVGILGALELLLMLSGAVRHPGRRIDLSATAPEGRPTARVAGCDCVNVY
jgi:adenylyltransferase/sulfurtransferase